MVGNRIICNHNLQYNLFKKTKGAFGESRPEIERLIELSSAFNVAVDYLVNENNIDDKENTCRFTNMKETKNESQINTMPAENKKEISAFQYALIVFVSYLLTFALAKITKSFCVFLFLGMIASAISIVVIIFMVKKNP